MDSHYEDNKAVIADIETEMELALGFRESGLMEGHDRQFDEEYYIHTMVLAHANLEVCMMDILNEMEVTKERHEALMGGDINSNVDEIMHTLMYSLMSYFKSLAVVKDQGLDKRVSKFGRSCVNTDKSINSMLTHSRRLVVDEELSIEKRLEAYRRYRVMYKEAYRRGIRKFDMIEFIDTCAMFDLLDS